MQDIILITGCMYSGKSKKLIEMIDSATQQDKRVACFKPSVDKRDKGVIKSRDYDKTFEAWVIGENGEVPTLPKGYLHTVDMVAVDETQFLDTNSIKWLLDIGKGYGIPIIFAGLSGDFKGQPFHSIEYLKQFKPTTLQPKADCFVCHRPEAVTSRRVVNNKIVLHGEQVLCGDTETYIALCDECDAKLLNELED